MAQARWLSSGARRAWELMPRIIKGDFTFVAKNAKGFRKL
jgi:hypothetical protein